MHSDEWGNAKESVNISVVVGLDYREVRGGGLGLDKTGIISIHATIALHTQPLKTGLPQGALDHRTKTGSPTPSMQILCQS